MLMATSTCLAPISFSTGRSRGRTPELWSKEPSLYGKTPLPGMHRNPSKKFAISAKHNVEASSGGKDFVAGFLLGGAVFGSLAYIFAPQIRRSLLNEDEYGFRRPRGPVYYEGGLEKTREALNEKIGQLNTAIDKVSARLRGKDFPKHRVESEPELPTE